MRQEEFARFIQFIFQLFVQIVQLFRSCVGRMIAEAGEVEKGFQ
jgi:hypothetical protein